MYSFLDLVDCVLDFTGGWWDDADADAELLPLQTIFISSCIPFSFSRTQMVRTLLLLSIFIRLPIGCSFFSHSVYNESISSILFNSYRASKSQTIEIQLFYLCDCMTSFSLCLHPFCCRHLPTSLPSLTLNGFLICTYTFEPEIEKIYRSDYKNAQAIFI